MNNFVLEVCNRNQYTKTMGMLKRKARTTVGLDRLDSFVLFKNTKLERTKSFGKLSFDVSDAFVSFIKNILQVNIDDENIKVRYFENFESTKESGQISL